MLFREMKSGSGFSLAIASQPLGKMKVWNDLARQTIIHRGKYFLILYKQKKQWRKKHETAEYTSFG